MTDSMSISQNTSGSARHPARVRSKLAMISLCVFALLAIVWCARFGMDLWLTPDQQGRRLFRGDQFEAAALEFHDPMWQGVAWYRAGEFAKAADAFSRFDTAEGLYNQGNAWLMRGDYTKATDCYKRALAKRPNWRDAVENRDLASARAAMVAETGGDMGDQKLGADKIVFDKKKNNEGQETQTDGAAALSNQEIQAIWLRRVQTRPADFLKAKFAYQHATQEGTSE